MRGSVRNSVGGPGGPGRPGEDGFLKKEDTIEPDAERTPRCESRSLPRPIDLYDIILQRYEHATIITSNRALEEWSPFFNDPLLAKAAMDRLLHLAHVIDITGTSFRDPPRGSKSKAS